MRLLLTAVTLILLLNSSCTPTSHKCSKTDAELPPAAIHITATTVTEWEEYVNELQPVFELTAQNALKQAVPETLQIEKTFQDAFRSRLSLKLAPSEDLPAGFGKEDSAGADLPDSKLGEEPSSPDSSDTKVNNRENLIVGDPFLKYWAASSLYQEIKLLNRFLKDLSYDKNKYTPFILQFLVDQVPYQRHSSFDTYLTMSFFNTPVSLGRDDTNYRTQESSRKEDTQFIKWEQLYNRLQEASEGEKELVNIASKLLELISPKPLNPNGCSTLIKTEYRQKYCQLQDITRAALESEKFPDQQNLLTELFSQLPAIAPHIIFQDTSPTPKQPTNPIVIPMLVADQVEAALLSRSAEKLRQTALAVAAAYAGIGGQTDLEKTSQELQAALGSTVNSRFTVGRVSDNTVRINFSARQTLSQMKGENEIQYSAEKRNHRVSLLVLVPNEKVGDTIHFGTRSTFVDPTTGKVVFASRDTGKTPAWLKRLVPVKDEKMKRNDSCLPHPLFDKKRLSSLGITLKNIEDCNVTNHINLLTDSDRLFLATTVRNNRYHEFIDFLTRKLQPEDDSIEMFTSVANSLWIELSEMAVGSHYTSGDVFIKKRPTPNYGNATPIVRDNGKVAITVLPGVSNLSLSALKVEWKGTKNPEFILAPKKTELLNKGALLKLTFDSPLALNLDADGSNICFFEGSSCGNCEKPIIYSNTSKKPGKQLFKFSILTKTIPAGDTSSLVLFASERKNGDFASYKQKCTNAEPAEKDCIVLMADGGWLESVTFNGTKVSRLQNSEKFSSTFAYPIEKKGAYFLKLKQPVKGQDINFKFLVPDSYQKIDPIPIKIGEKKE